MMRAMPLDGLAVRFALVLAAALVAANMVAAALLYVDRVRQDASARIEREVERIVSLVPALEAAAPDRRQQAARAASTRLTRVSLDAEPLVETVPTAPRSAALTRNLSEALDGREVRAALLMRRSEDGPGRRATLALSIRLSDGEGLWLNSVSRGDRRPPPGVPREVLVLTLVVSLLAVLGVALLHVRQLTRPLNDLAKAARAAGQGDRAVRVLEGGPREVRAASAAFNEMQGRIAQFDAERMRTLAAVGHDLRTPITSLRIRAEMLEPAQADPMIRTLDEMTVMADGLIAYARGAGDAEEPAALDLADLVRRLGAERGAAFSADGPVRVIGRPVALGRAIGNIIDNAIRYGGGAQVTLRRAEGSALVIVEDDGPGIPDETLAVITEPFVRGEQSRSGETGGAGLGLAIARSIIAAHGGALRLENRAAGGLRVTVTLPATD